MSNIKLFESKQIRTVWNESDQKWYFVVADVVQVLTDTPNPTDYIKKMRKRDELLSLGWGQIVTPLSVETAGGKQKLNCANAQGLLRIIQSISPSGRGQRYWFLQSVRPYPVIPDFMSESFVSASLQQRGGTCHSTADLSRH